MQKWKQYLLTIGDVMLFDYDYMREGKRRPDPLPQLLAAHRQALVELRQKTSDQVFLIGKSMIIAAENELQQKKIIELDARPSDCIAMATQQKAPIYVSQEVWDEVEDMSDVLRKMEEEGLKPEIDPEGEAEEE